MSGAVLGTPADDHGDLVAATRVVGKGEEMTTTVKPGIGSNAGYAQQYLFHYMRTQRKLAESK